jgi:hypothetical protein
LDLPLLESIKLLMTELARIFQIFDQAIDENVQVTLRGTNPTKKDAVILHNVMARHYPGCRGEFTVPAGVPIQSQKMRLPHASILHSPRRNGKQINAANHQTNIG